MPCEVQWLVNWTATGNAVMFWGAWTGCMSQASDYFKNNTVYHDINPEKRLCIKKIHSIPQPPVGRGVHS